MNKFIGGLVLATVIGAFTATAIASGAARVLSDIPIGGILEENDCSGEDLFLRGTAHIVIHNGNVHLKIADVTATGVDTDTVWASKSVSVQKTTTSNGENGATTTTTVFRIRLASGNDRFQAKITAHTTVNANGDVTSEFETETADCK